jgi:PIN domain nuclease of toxin-antitoxin system
MRNILLDTHIFLWSQFETAKLPDTLAPLFASPEIRWHISQISVLEIQIKHDTGRMDLPSPPGDLLPTLLERSGFAFRPLQNEAIFMLGRLPPVHRDPFDRLLVATALVNGWEIATVDAAMEKYPVRLVR